jgi:hypothetical protein
VGTARRGRPHRKATWVDRDPARQRRRLRLLARRPSTGRERRQGREAWRAAARGLLARTEQLLAERRHIGDEVSQPFWQACAGGQRRAAEYLLAQEPISTGYPTTPKAPARRSQLPWHSPGERPHLATRAKRHLGKASLRRAIALRSRRPPIDCDHPDVADAQATAGAAGYESARRRVRAFRATQVCGS